MSLTSLLKKKGTWVNQFFKDEFAYLTDFTRREGGTLKALPLKVPLGPHGQAKLVGTAFDYRLRLHLGLTPKNSTVLNDGIERMWMYAMGETEKNEWHVHDKLKFWADSTRALLREQPGGDELAMARASVVLAWLDHGFRSAGESWKWNDGIKTIALRDSSVETSPTWEEYSASVDEEVARDVANLFQAAKEHQCLPASDAIFGPTFAGSRDIGGADADLIIDHRLYDIKTTNNPRKDFPDHLRQLIAYALLDWDDKYELTDVGFYFSRQATYMSWPLSRLLNECTRPPVSKKRLPKGLIRGAQLVGPPPLPTLSTLRNRFRELAKGN